MDLPVLVEIRDDGELVKDSILGTVIPFARMGEGNGTANGATLRHNSEQTHRKIWRSFRG